jgi:competence protein ComEC
MTTFYFAQSPSWALLLMCIGVLFIVLPLLWPMRLCGLLCCLPSLMWQPSKTGTGEFELAALDVGQGLSLVIRTASHVMVYDTGPKFQSGSDTASIVVLPYLRSLGIRQLDMVMISHGDDDHAGGMSTLEQGMPVTKWLMGPSVNTDALSRAAWMRCQRDQHWEWDGVQFDVLSPQSADVDDGRNNTSCILRISTSGGSALLMGDAEAPIEQRLIDQHQIAATSIVVAGHHGSRTSSTPDFVNAVHAQQVIFSAGYLNRWGFPKANVVNRWRATNAHTSSTIDAGAITLRVASQGVSQPVWYRIPQRHYWQDIAQPQSN